MMTFLLWFLIGAFIGWPIIHVLMLKKVSLESWWQGYEAGKLGIVITRRGLSTGKEMNNDE